MLLFLLTVALCTAMKHWKWWKVLPTCITVSGERVHAISECCGTPQNELALLLCYTFEGRGRGEGGGDFSASCSLDLSVTQKYVNPMWTGLFPNLRRLKEGEGVQNAFPLPRNLAISNRMIMRLGTNILWVEIASNDSYSVPVFWGQIIKCWVTLVLYQIWFPWLKHKF